MPVGLFRNDMGAGLEGPGALDPLVGRPGADHAGQVHPGESRKFACLRHGGFGIDILAGHQTAGLGPLLAQDAGQPTGVDVGDRHHVPRLQILR